jgi:cation diffusion facilitator family transporter
MLIILMGFETLRVAVERIVSPAAVTVTAITIAVLAASMAVKLVMVAYNRIIGKRIGSPALLATANDSLADMVATGVVLACAIITQQSGVYLDGWCGLAVAAFILYVGISTFKSAIDPLLGQPPSPEFIQQIRTIAKEYPQITGIHDLVVHDYGPGRRMVSLHAEVPASGNIVELHDAVDNLEMALRAQLSCEAVIHMDPIATNDTLTNQTHARVNEAVKAIDPAASIHDFRMVAGPTHTKLVFDVAVPYSLDLSNKPIQQQVEQIVHGLDASYHCVVQVDRQE